MLTSNKVIFIPCKLLLISAILQSPLSFAEAPQAEITLAPVKVHSEKINTTEGSDSYTAESTTSATGLNLSLRETPQSVTVITRERMDDQAITTVFDALRNTTGVSVKAVDRGRSTISVRGFDVNNYQFDGVPTSLEYDNNVNTAMFDRIEVVRGATGLLSGAGNPSAAVNLVRKHANSKTLTGSFSAELGSWNQRSGTFDVTTPMNDSGSVRARLVANISKQDAFIDLESTKNSLFYGVIDADLTENTRLSLGASEQRDERDGVLWAGLPYWYSDGTHTDWSRSKTTAAKWNQWDVTTKTLFATLEHTFQNHWKVRANASRITADDEENMLWMWGDPDRDTGLGMEAYPYHYVLNSKQTGLDVAATGPFTLLGREHEATVGATYNKLINPWDNSDPLSSDLSFPVGDFNNWDGSYPQMAMGPRYNASKPTTTQSATYAAARLQLADPLKLIIGARLSNWKREQAAAAWTPEDYELSHNSVITPYVGAVYDLNKQTSAYASYTSIFNPQEYRDQNGKYLDPLEGNSYELGLKSELMNGFLNASAAIFRTEQDNFAIADGYVLSKPTEAAYRAGEGVKVQGYELEATGELQPDWSISVGWTQYSAKDSDDEDVEVDHPRKLFKLFTKYTLPGEWRALSVGGGVNWEGTQPARATNPVTGEEEKIGQSAYALVDLMAKYQLTQELSLQANLYNAFDKQYVSRNTGWWGGAYTYGEPRRFVVAMDYAF